MNLTESILLRVLQMQPTNVWDTLPVDPEILVGVVAFAILFALFGVRPTGEGEGAHSCGGCSSSGCGLDDCSSCELGADSGDHHGMSWRFASASETRPAREEPRR